MNNNATLIKDCNCFYLIMNISGLSLYQKTKAIDRFIKHETKILENCVENEIRAIFSRNGIFVQETDKNAVEGLFSALNQKGKGIELVDIYKNREIANSTCVGMSPNKMSVWLEDDATLQCGIEVKEIDIERK